MTDVCVCVCVREREREREVRHFILLFLYLSIPVSTSPYRPPTRRSASSSQLQLTLFRGQGVFRPSEIPLNTEPHGIGPPSSSSPLSFRWDRRSSTDRWDDVTSNPFAPITGSLKVFTQWCVCVCVRVCVCVCVCVFATQGSLQFSTHMHSLCITYWSYTSLTIIVLLTESRS